MERKLVSPEELQREIDARLNTKQEVLDTHATVPVPLPQRTAPDAGGCNWRVDFDGAGAGREDVISRVVGEMQGRYNLRE
jgi:hypothetical protein